MAKKLDLSSLLTQTGYSLEEFAEEVEISVSKLQACANGEEQLNLLHICRSMT